MKETNKKKGDKIMDTNITSDYAKRKADEFENNGKATTGWVAAENREDAAYWRGIQYVLQELEAGRVKGYIALNEVK